MKNFFLCVHFLVPLTVRNSLFSLDKIKQLNYIDFWVIKLIQFFFIDFPHKEKKRRKSWKVNAEKNAGAIIMKIISTIGI